MSLLNGGFSLGLLISTVFLGGCGTSPATRLFLPIAENKDVETSDSKTILGLRNVEIPQYLNNDYMPISGSGSELKRDEFQRWAEPFKDMLTELFVSSLEQSGLTYVISDPWPDFFRPNCSVWLRVTEWNVGTDAIDAKFSWALVEGTRKDPMLQKFKVRESKNGVGPDANATATAAIVSRLSSEVAALVKSTNACQAQYVDKKQTF